MNVLRVVIYRVAIKSRLHPVQRISAKPVSGNFYRVERPLRPQVAQPRDDWKPGFANAFGRSFKLRTNGPPEWFGYFGKPTHGVSDQPWWQIPDFDPNVGDIKLIWEASRFDFVPMAQRASVDNLAEIERLNNWLSDWSVKNPPYMGINWKCAQEASIRVMHLIASAWI